MATRSSRTSFGLTKCVMPNLSASALRRGIDVDADDLVRADEPRALDHVSPMPPRPNTTTFAPGSTFAVLMTAPIPVVTPQPM